MKDKSWEYYSDRNKLAQEAQSEFSNSVMVQRYMDLYDATSNGDRILLIDVNCKYSSTGSIVYDLYTYMKKYGRNASVCYGRGKKIKESNIIKFGYDWETNLHALLARITGYNGCFSFFSTRRLIKYIDKYKPDVIHIHELHAYFVNIKQLLKYIKKKNIPVVWTFHCEYMYTGKCGHAYECTRYMNECGKCPYKREYPKSLFFDKTKNMLKMKRNLLSDMNLTIVTPSKWLEDRVRTSFLKNKIIKVIPNGVDTSVFRPTDSEDLRKKLNISETKRVALFVAPDIENERKGGAWAIKLAQVMSDKNIVFVMIGKVNDTVQQMSNVIYVGEIKDKQLMAQYYSLADWYLLFSQRETYSMTCAEALCCGTRILGFKCGAPESVFSNSYAKFYDYGDIKQLTQIISESVD